MTRDSSLYAVVLRHAGLTHGYAVRASTPAAAVAIVTAHGERTQIFTSIVELETAPAEGDAAT